MKKEKKTEKKTAVMPYVIMLIAGTVSSAIMAVGGWLIYSKELDGESIKKLAIMAILISATVYISATVCVSLRTRMRKPAIMGGIPIVGTFTATFNPLLFMFSTAYLMMCLLIGFKIAEKKNPLVFFRKENLEKIEGREYQIPHCKHCGKPIKSLFQIKCSGCGKYRF